MRYCIAKTSVTGDKKDKVLHMYDILYALKIARL